MTYLLIIAENIWETTQLPDTGPVDDGPWQTPAVCWATAEGEEGVCLNAMALGALQML